MNYPSYQSVSQSIRDFFGEPDPKVQIPPQPVVLTGDISPLNYYLPFYITKTGTAAELTSIGIGVTGGKSPRVIEISDLWCHTEDTTVDLCMQNTFAGWDSTPDLNTARAGEFRRVQRIFQAKDDRVGGQVPDVILMNGITVVTVDTWFQIPGIYQLQGDSVFYAQTPVADKNLKLMGNVRAIQF